MAPSRVATVWRLCVLLPLLLFAFATTSSASNTALPDSQATNPPVYEPENQKVVHLPPAHLSSPTTTEASETWSSDAPTSTLSYSPVEANILHDLHSALSTMQDHYFAVWLGKYTSAIDWTAAVMSTYVSATLSTLSHSLSYTMPGTFDKDRKLDVEAQMVENEINKYFAQTTAYYFGEDHFAIRMQAFDDILWVVLGWLEASMFIESHSASHYTPKGWHASQFIPAFSHRARVFYELAEKGWDWRLCGGGMTWNPRLLPYKNAITNQLFISASISMYLHFPGDENCSPFLSQYDAAKPRREQLYGDCEGGSRGRYDPVYLANAVNGYAWLKGSGMLNDQGLYTDGFHIGGYRTNHSKTTCDERNEMVYTYNQGVVLSGLRGLWEATGQTSYLEDGHELVRNVIRATGWTNPSLRSTPSFSSHRSAKRDDKTPDQKEEMVFPNNWAGLGSNGILTELCDPTGYCSQNGQTFKGIFFHHLTAFCELLPARPARPGRTHAATREVAMLHANSCREYTAWVVHNGQAALRTRNEDGRFGSWWGVPFGTDPVKPLGQRSQAGSGMDAEMALPENATDYRNAFASGSNDYDDMYTDTESIASSTFSTSSSSSSSNDFAGTASPKRKTHDLNDRGRGRTVETQGSGVSVVRAMWTFLRRAEGGDVDWSV
ncbi:glycoside hydrolase family 76 protein [Stemphylium lycopersici]|nr:glycoside hydrolase family 76 protein [Stemphylium lycopersici]